MLRIIVAGTVLTGLLLAVGCGAEAEPVLPEGFDVLATATDDLDGDGRQETTRLVGRGVDDSPFREDLCLVIGAAARLWPLPTAVAGGYGPTLHLADVTGDDHPEILVTADTGGSGGLVAAAVVVARRTGDGWNLRSIYDSEAGPRPRLGGALADGFVAHLEVTAPGLPRRVENIDLTGRRAFYQQNGTYTADGDLATEAAIWGDGIMGLAPASAAAGGPGLRLVQQARGTANADRLAEIRTLLVWRDGRWEAASLEVIPLD